MILNNITKSEKDSKSNEGSMHYLIETMHLSMNPAIDNKTHKDKSDN